MKYFHAGAGANPRFAHRLKVKKVTNEMWTWCDEYDAGTGVDSDFRRWHVEFGERSFWVNDLGYDIIQFEWEQAALMFSLKFETL